MSVPNLTFHTRVRDDSIEGDNPYVWEDLTTDMIFKGRKVLVFSLPGAFTPTCSTFQLPDFERLAAEFYDLGIEDIYCLSVNDSFVMNAWGKANNLENVKLIPDGSGLFTIGMNMIVSKDNLSFGQRSWRYAMVVDNGVVSDWFEEPGKAHNAEDDPYGETSPQNILEALKSGGEA